MDLREYVKFEDKKAVLNIKVTPKSAQNQFSWRRDDWVLKFKIKWIPEKWIVNKEIIKFLSKTLKINKNNIQITSGLTSKNKTILITQD